MIKMITLLSLCLCLLSICSGKVFATEIIEEEVQEINFEISTYMNYISKASCFLYINSNGQATAKCSIDGYQGITTKVSITANLQQYKGGRWVDIKTSTQSSDSHRRSLSRTVSITKGYTYRVSAQVKACKGSSVETRNLISKQSKIVKQY